MQSCILSFVFIKSLAIANLKKSPAGKLRRAVQSKSATKVSKKRVLLVFLGADRHI